MTRAVPRRRLLIIGIAALLIANAVTALTPLVPGRVLHCPINGALPSILLDLVHAA